MKTTAIAFVFALAAFSFTGCRRTDVKEFTLSLPSLTEADKPAVTAALSKYDGVDKSSYVWDFKAKTLTLRYDSMKVGQTNIRQAIEAKGVEVVHPGPKNGVAGYIDTSFGR